MGGVWEVYIKVAASSPAWLTRRAESRYCFCSRVRDCWGGGVDVASVGFDDVDDIEQPQPLRLRAWSWKARGERRDRNGSTGVAMARTGCMVIIR
jgi:hypothetical protein